MAIERIRGRALQRLRAQVLTDNPLCTACLKVGRVTVATDVDHIVALVNNGNNELTNMQGLCSACHIDKTRLDLGQEPRAVFDSNGRVRW